MPSRCLLFLFLALPIAELYVIIQVGEAIGLVPTLLLLILDGFVGAALARSQGRTAWERFNRALAEGRVPAKRDVRRGDDRPRRRAAARARASSPTSSASRC